MALRVYDPKDIVISFGPASPVSGFADGTFVTVEKNEDAYTLQIGTDGIGTRSKSNNNSGRITLTLMQSSLSNDLLTSMHQADLNGDTGIFKISVKDLNGTSLYSAENAWIIKFPSAEYAREAVSREWVIETEDMIVFEGGNDNPAAGAV